MLIRVKVYPPLMEGCGFRELSVTVPEETTIAEALCGAARLVPSLRCLLISASEKDQPFAVFVNDRLAEPGDVVRAGDVLAVVPPIAGGA